VLSHIQPLPPTNHYATNGIDASLVGAWNPLSRDGTFVTCSDGVSVNIQYVLSELMLLKDLNSINFPWAVNLKYVLNFITLEIEDV